MGATPFAERTQTELQATGVTVAAVQPGNPALTAREHQIASMAAVGYTNQEIANRLFITANTVEYHLKKVFRKLSIDSRRQLRDKFQLSAPIPAPAPHPASSCYREKRG